MIPQAPCERDCDIPRPTADRELLAWYRKNYPTVDRNGTVAWETATRMRRERDRWQLIAAVVTALLVLLATYNVWSWWLS